MNKLTNDIWVLGDTRSLSLLNSSLNVLEGARELAALRSEVKSRTVFVLMKGAACEQEDESVQLKDAMEKAVSHGADKILVLTFASKQADILTGTYSRMLANVVQKKQPLVCLFPLNAMMREIAARTAFLCHSGLIADCLRFKYENGEIIAVCPSHGGEIMAELGFSDRSKTGFITVQPNAFKRKEIQKKNQTDTFSPKSQSIPQALDLEKLHLDEVEFYEEIKFPEDCETLFYEEARLISRRRKTFSPQSLETANKVVAGGAGLGNVDGFRGLRKLAAALGAQIGATRPPVLWHWTDEESLIGQTGKSIRPELLITVGTSGAVQYTAGITEAKKIVAINKDPGAPIFQFADIGIVEDAAIFIPLFTDKVQKIAMRSLADSIEKRSGQGSENSIGGYDESEGGIAAHNSADFGSKLMQMRTAHQLSQDDLAHRTGRTPEFIEELENNRTTPSVGFMIQLAEVFGVDSGTFLNEDERSALSGNRAKEYTRRTANYYYQTLTPGAENEHLRVFMVTIESNKKHKPVAYRHEGEEFVYVMEGILELTLEGKPHKLMAGESMKFNSQTPHQLKSLGSKDTRCLVTLYTP
ncbi:Electron transfer flavoprotein FAD-binding domain protein [Desulfamplus magnetovallimortis]|uniref:Electron transfer flavoprotein FAD-binding domain protein n=1 Tax=Desulfamplus magnetovallimortis TaxID=1246637 RepID=L0R525_9BACT|nr:FAD-binding protein [Desulfamplus magnetovallimortis]CCO06625.1 Electron transfer flavoprotein FAD-binding domain protein [Desulfamplus magnetovallimortis BW-1]SLM32676.1 Electron transfer flavoprotein FAD-binding domain protein [Desulfamplus magnetovallimortis]